MPNISRIVYEVLSQIGSHREARYYFDLFNHDDPMRFALITVENPVAKYSQKKLGSALGLLYHLGFIPIILHSSETDSCHIIDALKNDNVTVDRIEQNFIRTSVDLKSIAQAVSEKKVPVICGLDVDEQSLGEALVLLSKAILPHKIIILSQRGGLIDSNGRIISNVNLDMANKQTNFLHVDQSSQLLTLAQSYQLFKDMPAKTSISITSVENLVKELFTYKGAGTLIRIEDEIHVHSQFDQILEKKMSDLIEASFNRKLKEDYFDSINLDKLFISQSEAAMAIVLKNDKNIPYLDKFIVTPQAQGSGLGKVVWKKLSQHYDQLYWRARVNNPINSWYLRQADSTKREGEWIVFGQNIESEDWHDCIKDALSRTIHMVDI